MAHFDQIDDRVKNPINQAGFGRVMVIGQVEINNHLISVLVERWRTETHTFHFPYGETTITLQDVTLQLGLKIDGVTVTGMSLGDVCETCQVLLGVTPPDKYIKDKTIYLTWLRQLVQNLPADADEFVINQHARAHIMMLKGSCLMSDTSGAHMHFMYFLLLANLTKTVDYSWGAAVLTSLFRSLDRAVKPSQTKIGGCLLLLQSWAWDCITCIAPHVLPLSDDEVQQGLGFPLARRWSRPMMQTNISTNSVTLIRGIFDRLHINESHAGYHYHQSHVEPNVPPVHVSGFMPHYHQTPAQPFYPSVGFSGYMPQGYEQSSQPFGFSTYVPQQSFQVSSTSNISEGPSHRFDTIFNTPPSAYNPSPSTSFYRSSLPTQMRDMGNDDDDKDNDDNNTTNDDDDDGHDDDHVPHQQQRQTHDHPRTRGGRGGRTRRTNSSTNPVQQEERPRRVSRRSRCGTSSHY